MQSGVWRKQKELREGQGGGCGLQQKLQERCPAHTITFPSSVHFSDDHLGERSPRGVAARFTGGTVTDHPSLPGPFLFWH